jgi:hypothetical protein
MAQALKRLQDLDIDGIFYTPKEIREQGKSQEKFDWANEIDFQYIEGMPVFDEVLFYHRNSGILSITDLCYNYHRDDVSRAFGYYLEFVRGFRPLTVTPVFRNRVANHIKMRSSLDGLLCRISIGGIHVCHSRPVLCSGAGDIFMNEAYRLLTEKP